MTFPKAGRRPGNAQTFLPAGQGGCIQEHSRCDWRTAVLAWLASLGGKPEGPQTESAPPALFFRTLEVPESH